MLAWQIFRGLDELISLSLDGTKVTDAGLVNLEGLTHLDCLWLANTGVTDAGLVHLVGMKRLFDLGVSGTKVTCHGAAKLQKALPLCEVYGPKETAAPGK